MKTALTIFSLVVASADANTVVGCDRTIRGDCTPENFENKGCTAPDAEVERQCELATTHFGSIANHGYQFDKNFMDGGGAFNDLEIPFDEKDKEALEDFHGEYSASQTRISWPYYKALSEYGEAEKVQLDDTYGVMSNFGECDLRAVMCCTTAAMPGFDFTPNAKVCHNDLYEGRRSSHVYHGESVFRDDDMDAYCVGFSWKEGSKADLYKGNLLYEISYKVFLEKGYVQNIPGAPMCGCVDQMPSVTTAACVEIGDVNQQRYDVSYSSELSVTERDGLEVIISPCLKNGLPADLVQKYKGQGDKNFLKTKVLQAESCNDDRADFLNEFSFYVPTSENPFVVKPSSATWVKVAGQGSDFVPGSGLFTNDNGNDDQDEVREALRAQLEDGFKEKLAASKTKIVYRHCGTCLPEYIHLYYKRIDGNDDLDIDLFLNNWVEDDNELGVNYVLYTNYEDACANNGNPDTQFTVCGYKGDNYGFPGQCGLKKEVECQWNNYNGDRDVCPGFYSPTTTAFYVDNSDRDDCQ